MSPNPPVIGFELGVGEFRIVTPEAVYQIRVLPDLVVANTDLGVLVPNLVQGTGAANRPSVPISTLSSPVDLEKGNGGTFFQEISEELFERVGQLARQLSVSVGQLPSVPQSDLSKTGHDLEDAKGQLEEVVELTEKASLTILDLADQIQLDMDKLNLQMANLKKLESLLAVGSEADSPDLDAADADRFVQKFAELKKAMDSFDFPQDQPSAPPELSESPAEATAAIQSVSTVVFNVATVFQTLYEFCTNESVKEHIKAMIAAHAQGQFNSAAIEAQMNEQAKDLDDDDGFYNYPIPALLKILYANTDSEEFRTTLKKMNQTVGNIFLENNLPIEGQIELVEMPPAEPAPVKTESANDPGQRALGPGLAAKNLIDELSDLLPAALNAGSSTPKSKGYAAISVSDRDTIVETVATSEKMAQSITRHLTHIMEALSFQDLSGQRIKRIVSLLDEIQVQLLTVLVSVNTKIKAHHNAPTTYHPKEETEKVAQAEVDRMLEKLSTEPSELQGPGAENRLDQGAVNDLLAQMGF
ncbi:MAG: protein phosphatase CheZ [Deltaproteobacteria bacterium]|jgi:chemotaxis regulatin CheY-phosphate phosphatase CheZ|nr:protein phosphatase CheZ [Deltaproteobacteria bacterium]